MINFMWATKCNLSKMIIYCLSSQPYSLRVRCIIGTTALRSFLECYIYVLVDILGVPNMDSYIIYNNILVNHKYLCCSNGNFFSWKKF